MRGIMKEKMEKKNENICDKCKLFKDKGKTGIDIDSILKEEITNVICINLNEPNMDLFAQAFYDIYIKP